MSDSKNNTIPRMELTDEEMFHLGPLVNQLYDVVVETFKRFPQMNADEVMTETARNWHQNRRQDFLLLVKFWSHDAYEAPDIWGNGREITRIESPTGTAPDQTLVYRQVRSLKPFDELPLAVSEWCGGGVGFYVCFDSWEFTSKKQREALMDLCDQRDIELGVLVPQDT